MVLQETSKTENGSEFVAATTLVEQVIDLHLTLDYLVVPIQAKNYVFGDNKTMVKVVQDLSLNFTNAILLCPSMDSGRNSHKDYWFLPY